MVVSIGVLPGGNPKVRARGEPMVLRHYLLSYTSGPQGRDLRFKVDSEHIMFILSLLGIELKTFHCKGTNEAAH